MHEVNRLLLEKAEKFRDNNPKDQIIRRLLWEYENAALLSHGLDYDRSYYWSKTAFQIEKKISDRLIANGVVV